MCSFHFCLPSCQRMWSGILVRHPSKYETFTQCRYNVVLSSTTLAQHCTNIGWTSRVCWHIAACYHGYESTLYLNGVIRESRNVEPMVVWCWISVTDGGPTSTQHCFNVSCLLGYWNPCQVEMRRIKLTGLHWRIYPKYTICWSIQCVWSPYETLVQH